MERSVSLQVRFPVATSTPTPSFALHGKLPLLCSASKALPSQFVEVTSVEMELPPPVFVCPSTAGPEVEPHQLYWASTVEPVEVMPRDVPSLLRLKAMALYR